LAQTAPNKTQTKNITNNNINHKKLYWKTQRKTNLVDDNKHNTQPKMYVLNWHHQNPNIITGEMLMVLLQQLRSKV
jgi:hypothetical protein